MLNINMIKDTISSLEFVQRLYDIEEYDSYIKGKVEILFQELEEDLEFEFIIYTQYPFKERDNESIKFYNKKLIPYNHVMEDGSICIHTSHSTNIEKKLCIDFQSLKYWIEKYYINKNDDLNYEHIIVNNVAINDRYTSFLFTEINTSLAKGDYGEVLLIKLNDSIYKNRTNENFLAKSFRFNKKEIISQLSEAYCDRQYNAKGLFYFAKDHPARLKKFIFTNWIEFKDLFSQEFLNYLHDFRTRVKKKSKITHIPLFIGYEIPTDEIYWQVAILNIDKFPIKGDFLKLPNQKKQWNTVILEQEIQWALSRDISYKYFFGRGALCNRIVDSKILIIGIGAIGSIMAKTLTRSGCKHIDIADFDVKEVENVCRSEYFFEYGLSDKTMELQSILNAISPFINVNIIKEDYFQWILKSYYNDRNARENLINNINQYSIVIDCTTDNDLMYILDSLELNCEIINLSITNHAENLVCAFYPNIYNFVKKQFTELLNNDTTNLYEPTGCWNPTFKASYNDINLLVQMALNHINHVFSSDKEKRNFVIGAEGNDISILKVKEY